LFLKEKHKNVVFMHQAALLITAVVIAAAFSWVACRFVRSFLLKKKILDRPNSRSLHTSPCPRGGGLGIWMAFIPVVVLTHILMPFLYTPPQAQIRVLLYLWEWQAPILAAMGLLIFISWKDDRKSLPFYLRLGAHVLAIVFVFSSFSENVHVLKDWPLPLWLDRLIAGFAWLWFINLTNFMDGMDGLSGSEAIHLCIGFILLIFLSQSPQYWETHPLPYPPMVYAACLLGAVVGFLFWNWPRAKLFLGDVGSIPLGFLLGYFMLMLAGEGYWYIALALPLYYLADATITLLRRILQKKKFWQAHREHFYQKAAMAVKTQETVLYPIIAANTGLLIVCVLSLKMRMEIIFLAPLIVGVLMWYLRRLAK
jgi:UDP-N-acetylmuramyl pentapeptide phosphotransferase/UDP-N-acetylglucosamine-1-phosphate transferase